VDSGEQAATERGEHVFGGAISHTVGELLLAKPLSVPLGDVVVSGDPSFYAGEVGGPLAELFGCLLQRDAELLSEGSEVGDVRRCNRAEYLTEDFPGDVAFEAAHGFSFALTVGGAFGNVVLGSGV
jgi:hypothetical protein